MDFLGPNQGLQNVRPERVKSIFKKIQFLEADIDQHTVPELVYKEISNQTTVKVEWRLCCGYHGVRQSNLSLFIRHSYNCQTWTHVTPVQLGHLCNCPTCTIVMSTQWHIVYKACYDIWLGHYRYTIYILLFLVLCHKYTITHFTSDLQGGIYLFIWSGKVMKN